MGEGDSDLGLEEETSTKYSEAVQTLIRSGTSSLHSSLVSTEV